MCENLEVPLEQVKESAVKFDLANLKLEIDGLLTRLKGNSEALHWLSEMLSEASQECSEAISELESRTPNHKEQRIPHD
jgi:uncharacterized protein involved in exopolysaccharide biosynthesis